MKRFIISLIILISLFLLVIPAQAQQGLIDRLTEQLGGRQKGVFVETPAETVFVNIIMWIMSIIGIICVAFIIWGAVMYAISGGNEEQITRAKKILFYAIIGLVIAILALTIAQFVTRVVRGGEWCMLCWEIDPETGTWYETGTPFETQSACQEAAYYAQEQGHSCSCQSGPCPSP